ncbi:MAG TPA: hypothetical protein PKI46_07920, partial [Bacteroidales bacterium]|nr:hypothetical protein [Bacteroidales bacterium]
MANNEINLQANLNDNMSKGLQNIAGAMEELIKISKQQINLQLNTNEIIKANGSLNNMTYAFRGALSASEVLERSLDGVIGTFRNFDGTLNSLVKTIFTVTLQLTAIPFKMLIPLSISFVNVLVSLGKTVFELIGGLGNLVKGFLSFGASIITLPATIASTVIGGLTSLVGSLFSTGANLGDSLIKGILSPFTALASLITSSITSAFSGIVNLIVSPFQQIGSVISSVGGMVVDLLINPFSSFFSVITGGLGMVVGGF